METLEWAIAHGVAGVLAVVCAFQTYAIRALYAQNAAIQQARIDDLKAMTEAAATSQDKLHKAAADLARFADYSSNRRPLGAPR